jgi:class 3 adenylate cyclase
LLLSFLPLGIYPVDTSHLTSWVSIPTFFYFRTIGDAYICATNLMENQDSISVRNAAIRALAMAKDMVLEAVNTQIPKFSEESNENENVEEEKDANAVPPWVKFETLEIRVGIHVGEVMCGVLGQRLPKFTTCGKGRSIQSLHHLLCILLFSNMY